jgi:CxxC-x17-CxxC domain-containing protein
VSQFADKSLVCRDCGNEFVFTSGEQEFYAARAFSEPTRCPECRSARKASRDAGGGAGFDSGWRSGAARTQSATRTSGPRQTYKAICADCGTETEVPFEPRQGRPVYCRSCFEKRNGGRR